MNGIKEDRQRFYTLAKFNFADMSYFLVYDIFLKEVKLNKVRTKVFYISKAIDIEFINSNNLLIKSVYSNDKQEELININNVGLSPTLLRNIKLNEKLAKEHMLLNITIKNKRYYIYNTLNGINILRSNPKLVSRNVSYLKTFSLKSNFFIFGLFKHNAYKAKHQYDYIYLQNNHNRVAKFHRPFKNTKVLNQLVWVSIPKSKVENLNRIHTNLLCGNKGFILHNLSVNNFAKPMKTLFISTYKNNQFIVRNNLSGNMTCTVIPKSPEYKFLNKLKLKIAKISSKFNQKKNVNLYFEKKSERAEESAIMVFDKVVKSNTKSYNYFILDSSSADFHRLKKLYGNKLVKKYSFKHFSLIYRSNYFVSSELPNHLINDRIYIDDLRDKIMNTPSVFLQHGIMFAKPVDNPMAYGFHKRFNKYRNIKNVVSSELEAQQFYKMGYEKKDLMKTGLATFDKAILESGADKIAFMPTYRYWEEKMIYSGDIVNTSYYQQLIRIIDVFEQNNLLDRLLIVPHNKFSEYIYQFMPQYQNIIESNPSNALKISKIFITDYSSAIYDAIYRGAYPIFYWKEKEYLIENYKAIPPVNNFNAPGPIANNEKELIDIIKNAINNNFKLEEIYKNKYLKINEFTDNNNTQRIVDELAVLNII